ncbi:sigma-70 family RNA polymerase sigma factor [Corynebacterium macclintockiae]|uniref:sigma-70 family RNA polymerase sigma factor n=1 Tax=Corynebacterium TaxID=1716 RepID=UPI002351F0A9|nr:sigma-70 family RNA polymerase sigma factor [Corynebacterium sp.]
MDSSTQVDEDVRRYSGVKTMAALWDADEEIQDLLPAAIAQDRCAVNRLIELVHPKVVVFCRGKLGMNSYPTPDDVAQDVCIAIVKALPRYEDKGAPFMAFVYRVARNKVTDAYRAQQRDMSDPADELPEEESFEESPEQVYLSQDACNDFAKKLDILSEKSREILILRVIHGYSAEETAKIVGSKPTAVRVAQHRAVAKLKKHGIITSS